MEKARLLAEVQAGMRERDSEGAGGEAFFRKEIRSMEDHILEISKQISGLERERLEDRHAVEDRIGELQRTVEKLTGRLQEVEGTSHAVGQKIPELEQRLGGLVSKPEVQSMVDECLRNPQSLACRLISDLAEEKAQAVQGQGLKHEKAEDFWACPECAGNLVKTLPKFPDQVAQVLQSVGAEAVRKHLKKLDEAEKKKKAEERRKTGYFL